MNTVMISFFFALGILIGVTNASYSFLGLGDWGGAQLGGQIYDNVIAVAQQMAATATSVNAQFVINTGDNFYWCGIQNTSDPQITNDYLNPYAYPSLQIRWYSSLGNHEYGYNVTAQIAYTQLSSTWYMPARYYTKRIQLSGNNYLSLVVLDTSPCVSDYRQDNPILWDPCMTEYPTCSQQNTDDDFEGPCMFHPNILSQDCSAQYSWLKATLQGIPTNDWLIVVGHHPIDECNVKDLASLIQQRGFSLYMNGHTHILDQYQIDGTGAYITTGAGSMVDTADQSHPTTAAKLAGQRTTSKNLKSTGGTTHEVEPIWQAKVAGFTLHTFNSDFTQLSTSFMDYLGNNLRTIVVNKQGKLIG